MHTGRRVGDRWGKVFFVRASLSSTTTKQAGEPCVILELRMRVEVCPNDLDKLLLLELLPSLHWYHQRRDDLHKVVHLAAIWRMERQLSGGRFC